MKCYNHHDRDAFGICKVCGKGLCLECLKKEKDVIVCKNDKHCATRLNQYRTGIIIAFIIIVVSFILKIM